LAIKQIMDDLKDSARVLTGWGRYMQENDNLIEKQVRYLNAYIQTAGQATDSMGKHFDKADDAITRLLKTHSGVNGGFAQGRCAGRRVFCPSAGR
jgi:hypothetical protein